VARSPEAQLLAKKAENFLRTWAKEDVYFTLDREIELLKEAGFQREVTWRRTASRYW
jgi:hypothetical protein